jgi:ATP-dependent RNA helicase RhlE
MSFKTFNLNLKIYNNLRALGYTSPTPIQSKSIPPIMQGRDVMGLAQTGTGKTAAFALPILHRLLNNGQKQKQVRALIIAPTRELSEQTTKAIGLLGKGTKLAFASIYGGVSIHSQVQTLHRGCDIVSACPGRLLDHVNRGTIDLSNIEFLVLDEADQMFDMGFLPDIRKIMKHLPKRRQNLLFSATMPAGIKVLANNILHDPITVQIGHKAPATTVSHTFYPVKTQSKTALLRKILEDTATGPVIVFTRTKRRSKNVARQLENSGYEVTALHGNMTQNRRQKALDGFHRGIYKILVATDIAARGIDVRKVSHVINYDIPGTVDAYTHRIGRTGRAQATGDAFTFIGVEDKDMELAIKGTLGDKLKYCVMDGFSWAMDAPRHPVQRRRQSGPWQKRSRKAGGSRLLSRKLNNAPSPISTTGLR